MQCGMDLKYSGSWELVERKIVIGVGERERKGLKGHPLFLLECIPSSPVTSTVGL